MIELDPADDATARALGITRVELSPSSVDKARLRAALGLPPPALPSGTAAGRPPAPAAGPELPLTPLAAPRASRWLGGALGVALFGAGVATGWVLRPAVLRPLEPLVVAAVAAPIAAPVAADLAPAPRAEAATAADTAAEGLREVAQTERAAQRSRRAPSAHAAVPPLAAELALLRRVERALRNSDPALALALLSELDARFPQTRLAEERLAARTMAECRQQGPAAALHARAFLREHPASVYSERVQKACALESAAADSAR